ncbi:hypothetical protein [Phytoactinopolyspora limicola]|uniref:hypothetical protein n=1 Tax=Phytoactinopolyspora limicola TaxID=2715536 RepID=UPI0031B58A61
MKLGPALAAGNSVVIKPRRTPRCACCCWRRSSTMCSRPGSSMSSRVWGRSAVHQQRSLDYSN